jgi:hypothetical protein
MARLYARITMRLPRLGERFGQPRRAPWHPRPGWQFPAGKRGRTGQVRRNAANSGHPGQPPFGYRGRALPLWGVNLLRGRYHPAGNAGALGAVFEDEHGGGRKVPDRLGQQDAYDDRIGHLGADDRDDDRRQRTGHQAD